MNELFSQMEQLWNEFSSNHQEFIAKGNKAAAGRARVAIGEIKKKVTDYRKLSVDEVKKK